jgi:hypothetical protein
LIVITDADTDLTGEVEAVLRDTLCVIGAVDELERSQGSEDLKVVCARQKLHLRTNVFSLVMQVLAKVGVLLSYL